MLPSFFRTGKPYNSRGNSNQAVHGVQELYPAMPSAEPFDGELCKVTEFDRTRQESCSTAMAF